MIYQTYKNEHVIKIVHEITLPVELIVHILESVKELLLHHQEPNQFESVNVVFNIDVFK